jgi:hypothetical protein
VESKEDDGKLSDPNKEANLNQKLAPNLNLDQFSDKVKEGETERSKSDSEEIEKKIEERSNYSKRMRATYV